MELRPLPGCGQLNPCCTTDESSTGAHWRHNNWRCNNCMSLATWHQKLSHTHALMSSVWSVFQQVSRQIFSSFTSESLNLFLYEIFSTEIILWTDRWFKGWISLEWWKALSVLFEQRYRIADGPFPWGHHGAANTIRRVTVILWY